MRRHPPLFIIIKSFLVGPTSLPGYLIFTLLFSSGDDFSYGVFNITLLLSSEAYFSYVVFNVENVCLKLKNFNTNHHPCLAPGYTSPPKYHPSTFPLISLASYLTQSQDLVVIDLLNQLPLLPNISTFPLIGRPNKTLC
jgi:hypothetical protein